MKFKIVLFFGLVVIALIFIIFTQRSTYYSNSGEHLIKEKFFDFDCALTDSKVDGKQRLIVDFDFHSSTDQQVLQQLSLVPIRNTTDTLKMESEYRNSEYVFLVPAAGKIEKLDLMINYKVDSAGIIILKSRKYYNLEKVHTYRLRNPFY